MAALLEQELAVPKAPHSVALTVARWVSHLAALLVYPTVAMTAGCWVDWMVVWTGER